MLATNGSSDFEKSFLALDVGSLDYIEELNKVNSSNGGEGMPLYLRVVSGISAKDGAQEKYLCEGTSSTIFIDGTQAVKCEYLLFGSSPSVSILFKKDANSYSIQSNRYSGNDKTTIDQIISTFRLR